MLDKWIKLLFVSLANYLKRGNYEEIQSDNTIVKFDCGYLVAPVKNKGENTLV